MKKHTRPTLNTEISVQDFKDYYWYKAELIDFCRAENLDKRGGKIDLVNRIEKYLTTGETEEFQKQAPHSSRFDWNTEKLTASTIITDNYKNTENVRSFFKQQLGAKFRFNVKFMNWMKSARGKSLGDAVTMWKKISTDAREAHSPKGIAPQFEYNIYIRDFMKDNPGKTMQDAIRHWNMKKAMPGDHKYSRSDLL
jgi:hypothetical protein